MKISNLLKFFTCLFMLAAASPVFAAGYTCPTLMKYTSCNDGYYLSDCGSAPFNGGTATGTTGNSCIACPSGYTCTGSNTTCPVPAARTCAAGTYWNGSACTSCTAGYYCPGFSNVVNPASGHGRTECATASYSAAGASVCTPCLYGWTNVGTANTGCDTNCPNKGSYEETWEWIEPTWDSTTNTVINACVIGGCWGGYYTTDPFTTACMAVGPGFWSPPNSIDRTPCPDGLTTIGESTGADEAADCGRILHVGEHKIYLRSEKKSTPALHVNIDGTTYYGNMATFSNGIVRISVSEEESYTVFDDWIGVY